MKTVESKSTFTLGYQFDALLRIAGLKRPKQADNAIDPSTVPTICRQFNPIHLHI